MALEINGILFLFILEIIVYLFYTKIIDYEYRNT